jgi:xanthine dehydrogenase accessory factor
MAVITADGAYHGWLGGNCTQPVVRREAARALADGQPRLVSLSPDPARDARPGIVALPMTCHSGGSVEIYLEPVLPPPRLLLFGDSPGARALAQLGKAMGYSVDAGDPAATASPSGPAPFAVVATMGENDEESLIAALAAQPAYLAVVASRKRFAQIRETLLARGISAEALDRVKNPAGLDIGARLPEEVALSIIAEIVQLRRAHAAQQQPAAPAEREEIDPICGMTVTVATARHRATHAGREFYFCNARCREKFVAEPERWLKPRAVEGGR